MALMSQIFVVSVSVPRYKCMFILFVVMYSFYVWMSDILKVGGSICCNSFFNPNKWYHSSLLIKPHDTFSLSFLHPVLFLIPGILFLFFISFYHFVLLSMVWDGLRSSKFMRSCLQCYMWVGMDGMVIIGHRSYMSTFGANKDTPRLGYYI